MVIMSQDGMSVRSESELARNAGRALQRMDGPLGSHDSHSNRQPWF